jgi:opacity protein-like surface antigen
MSQDFGQTNFMAEFTGGWRWGPANSPVVVGVGAFIDFAGTNAGESAGTNFGSLKIKQENRYGLSVDVGPNWRTMPYVKLTYAWSRFEGELGVTGCSSSAGSQTASGWGFGAGVRHLQTSNLYFFAELLYQDYGNERFNQTLSCGVGQVPANVDFSANNFIGVVGAGWKF